MLQLTSRRFLRELDEAPGGNNLQYILKCPCILFFGNQGLHNEIMLGGNGGCSRVMCEGSPYIYPPSKVAVSQSNGSGVTPYKSLGKLSDILHLNNRNKQLERRARPPRNVPLDA